VTQITEPREESSQMTTANLTFTEILQARIHAVVQSQPWADPIRYPDEVGDLVEELMVVITKTIAEHSVLTKVGA
jgi:hypothetical protein